MKIEITCTWKEWDEFSRTTANAYTVLFREGAVLADVVHLTTFPTAKEMFDMCRRAGMGESPGNYIRTHEAILGKIYPGTVFHLP